MDPLPCLPNMLVQFPVLIPEEDLPRENAEARLDGGVVLLSHSNLNGGDGATHGGPSTPEHAAPYCSSPKAKEGQMPVV